MKQTNWTQKSTNTPCASKNSLKTLFIAKIVPNKGVFLLYLFIAFGSNLPASWCKIRNDKHRELSWWEEGGSEEARGSSSKGSVLTMSKYVQAALYNQGDRLCPPQYYDLASPYFQTLRRPCSIVFMSPTSYFIQGVYREETRWAL